MLFILGHAGINFHLPPQPIKRATTPTGVCLHVLGQFAGAIRTLQDMAEQVFFRKFDLGLPARLDIAQIQGVVAADLQALDPDSQFLLPGKRPQIELHHKALAFFIGVVQFRDVNNRVIVASEHATA